jgi:transcriptional regulator with XRE-family HTH domain
MIDDMNKDWRESIRKIIKDKGLSLREVSLRLGQSEGYLKVLLSRSGDPGVNTLSKICDELRVPISSLIDDIPENPEALQFAREFAELTPEQQSAIRTIMLTMSGGSNKP